MAPWTLGAAWDAQPAADDLEYQYTGGGMAVADFNGDGRADVYLPSSGASQLLLSDGDTWVDGSAGLPASEADDLGIGGGEIEDAREDIAREAEVRKGRAEGRVTCVEIHLALSESGGEEALPLVAELGEIVDERIQALEAVLQNAERMTRRLIKAEMELEHLSGNETELTLQASTLEDQVAAARSRNAEIEATHQRLLAERDQLAARQRALADESEELRGTVETLREEVQQAETDASSLRNENTSLRTKAKTLQENVTRMRQLRDELMSSISGLTQQMSGLAGGDPEG